MRFFSPSPDNRYQRRMKRIARWQPPLSGRRAHAKAWANMLLSDHGIFRLVYLNYHQVTPNLWRSAQPAPHQILWLHKQGLRTIINLRGGRDFGSFPLEVESCETLGIPIEELVIRSREAPTCETIFAAKDLFERLTYPALIHCKSGADRAGFMSVLYLILHEQRPLDEAMAQLSLRYGHFKSSKTGILDAFFDQYAAACQKKTISFLDWVANDYDREALQKNYHSNFWGGLLGDTLLRRE